MRRIDFLMARIEEDEARAQAATVGPWEAWRMPLNSTKGGSQGDMLGVSSVWSDALVNENIFTDPEALPDDVNFIANYSPARVLAECEAKRKLIDQIYEQASSWDGEVWCSHYPEDLRDGFVAAEGVGDHDDPLPEDCQGLKVVNAFLAPMLAVYQFHPQFKKEWLQ